MTKKLGLYILSYRRASYLREALDSILKQTYKDVEIIVSDNSPDNSVQTELSEYLIKNSTIRFLRRIPSSPSLDHFNLILKECQQYEYAMLFHDDDLLSPEAINLMIQTLDSKPQHVAISCNAYFMEGDKFTNKLFNTRLLKNVDIHTPKELIKRYTIKRLGHTPFPSYIYRTNVLVGIELDPNDGGKYSDVSFLVKLIRKGSFYWISTPLMHYRRHSSNDSRQLDLNAISRLSFFFFKESPSSVFYILFYFSKYFIKKIILLIQGF